MGLPALTPYILLSLCTSKALGTSCSYQQLLVEGKATYLHCLRNYISYQTIGLMDGNLARDAWQGIYRRRGLLDTDHL